VHDPRTWPAFVGNGISSVAERQKKQPFLITKGGEVGGRSHRSDRDKIAAEVRRLRGEFPGLRIEMFDVDAENFTVVFSSVARIRMWVGPGVPGKTPKQPSDQNRVKRDIMINDGVARMMLGLTSRRLFVKAKTGTTCYFLPLTAPAGWRCQSMAEFVCCTASLFDLR